MNEVDDRNRFSICRQPDGSWLMTRETSYVIPETVGHKRVARTLRGGWDEVAALRVELGAIDWFPNSQDYFEFCEEFGLPPDPA